MSDIARPLLQLGGQAAGFAIGGPIGGFIGGLIGGSVGSFLFPVDTKFEGPRLGDLRVQGSGYGRPIPWVFGTFRLSGNLIDATDLLEVRSETEMSAKSGDTVTTTTYTYFGTFAVGICKGPIAGIKRIWADGKIIYDGQTAIEALNPDIDGIKLTDYLTVYTGAESQLPSPTLEALHGVGNTPAYRGLAYIVANNLPLGDYGNRIPNLEFEVVGQGTILIGDVPMGNAADTLPNEQEPGTRIVYDYERQKSYVSMKHTTSAGRLGFATMVSYEECQNGADWQVFEQFADFVPHGRGLFLDPFRDKLVTGLYGPLGRQYIGLFSPDTLALEQVIAFNLPLSSRCVIQDIGAVDETGYIVRLVRDTGLTGEQTVFEDRVAKVYLGGTAEYIDITTYDIELPAEPAISLLDHIGYEGNSGDVPFPTALQTQWPTMEAALDNLNEYLSSEAVPASWRGKIQASVPGDGSSGFWGVRYTIVEDFDLPWGKNYVTPNLSGFGPYETLEYRTSVNGGLFGEAQTNWGAPWGLVSNGSALADYALPRQIRLIAGADACSAGYSQDGDYCVLTATSEYLADDSLRVRKFITDARVGLLYTVFQNGAIYVNNSTGVIQVYPPYTFGKVYDACLSPDSTGIWVLMGSGSHRELNFVDAQAGWRTPLSVFEDALAHRLVATSKDFVYVIKTNQIIAVSKDTGIVQRAIPVPGLGEAIVTEKGVLQGLDNRLFVDTLLALPTDMSEVIKNISTAVGVSEEMLDTTNLNEIQIQGFLVPARTSARNPIASLCQLYGVDVVETGNTLRFQKRANAPYYGAIGLESMGAEFDKNGEKAPITATRAQTVELPKEVEFLYSDPSIEYRDNLVRSRRLDVLSEKVDNLQVPMVLPRQRAQAVADAYLASQWINRDTFEFTVQMQYADIEPGDVLDIETEAGSSRVIIIRTDLSPNGLVKIKAACFDYSIHGGIDNTPALGDFEGQQILPAARPNLVLIDSAILLDSHNSSGFYAAAYRKTKASRFQGASLLASLDGGTLYTTEAYLTKEAIVGELLEPLPAINADDYDNTWSYDTDLRVRLFSGALYSANNKTAVLNGANALLVGNEIIQFLFAGYDDSTDTYLLRGLLRGRKGTEWASGQPAGTRVVALDEAVIRVAQPMDRMGVEVSYKAVAPGQSIIEATAVAFTNNNQGLECLSPVNLASQDNLDGSYTLSWMRRTRIGGQLRDRADAALGESAESYEVRVYDSANAQTRSFTVSTSTAQLTPTVEETHFTVTQTSTQVGTGFESEKQLIRAI